MNERVDFSTNAPIYDRRHGSVLLPDVAQSLASAAELARGGRVVDIGAGTGRVALALANLGCDVVALEPALQMLSKLGEKAEGQRLLVVAGDGTRLPFPPASFDAVVLARVLYLMSDWQAVLREACSALKPGGRLLHEWGNGDAEEAWVHVARRRRAGGSRSNADAARFSESHRQWRVLIHLGRAATDSRNDAFRN